MSRLESKVAFITGAARGQGRSHAVRLAAEGADIVGIDICRQLDSVNYAMSTPDDLAETVRQVESRGGRMLGIEADVRDLDGMHAAVARGLREFGRLDIVLANAGVMTQSLPPHEKSRDAWRDGIDVLLTGVWHTLQATYQPLIDGARGGSIVITSSSQGLRPFFSDLSGGFDSYAAAKAGVIGLMRSYAATLAEWNIRVNSIHPTGVNTPMVVNEFFGEYMEKSNPKTAARVVNALPVELVEPIDVSEAVLYLVCESGRYVTGTCLPVDAGLVFAG
ncbi:MAG TPA: mycofactocin-coupled SDR family oxidoreductase [Actinomycetospora sp.]|uniref:mycofactocin-coupled SDR family oxidoreductase n=1 Tax=Actinomycetospora sp. TaxID=1872135 RepID=UPI002F3E6622